MNKILKKRISKRESKFLPQIKELDAQKIEEELPPITVTADKYKKLQKELVRLKKRREDLNEAWRLAVEEGDDRETDALSVTLQLLEENEIDTRKTEDQISRAVIVDENSDTNVIEIGTQVKIRRAGDNTERLVTLVDPIEANPLEGKISVESPIGKAIMSGKVGESVAYSSPNGISVEITIVEID